MYSGIEGKFLRDMTKGLISRSSGIPFDQNDNPVMGAIALSQIPSLSHARFPRDPNNMSVNLQLQNSNGSYVFVPGIDGPLR